MHQPLGTVPLRAYELNTRPYRPLGIFRLFLAGLVLVSHSASLISPTITPLFLGNVGVLAFFAVSGFVISEALDRFYRNEPLRFLVNRGLKIFPAYWAALLLAVLAHALAGEPLNTDFRSIVANVLLPLGYFPSFSGLAWISITWAVIIELQFYAIAALVAAACVWSRSPRTTVGLVLVASIAGYVFVAATGTHDRFFGALQFAPFFVVGIAAYSWIRGDTPWWVTAALGVVSIQAFVGYVGRGDGDLVVAASIFVLVLVAFLFLISRPCPVRLRRIDQAAGDLSYPVYLLHMPVIVVATSSGLGIGLVITGTFLAAIAVHLLAERPLKEFRASVRRTRLA